MNNYTRGLRLAREVFQQEIGTMLTDERAVQITNVMASYPLRTKQEIIEWIGTNVADTWQPFPEREGFCPCGCDA